MRYLRHDIEIVVLSVLAAIVYGVVHDQVTAQICVEYFAEGSADIGAEDATVRALLWGVLGTWWMGLVLGVFLTISARSGLRPKLRASALVLPLLFVLIRVSIFSLLGGWIGYKLAEGGSIGLADKIPGRGGAGRVDYVGVLWAQWTAYGAASIEGAVLCFRTWRRRGKIEPEE